MTANRRGATTMSYDITRARAGLPRAVEVISGIPATSIRWQATVT
ncbi:hypothetical protein OG762_30105 [Streptomyces sp. NBC_01136]|nr:hypothetical protein OG762_30105 [Streptomyces sp. NBC_01136]